MRRVFSVLVFVALTLQLSSAQKVCSTPSCIKAAAEIYKYINPEIDPCDDFYGFACGTYRKDDNLDGDQYILRKLPRLVDKQKLRLLQEDIKEDDYNILKLAKRLHRGCSASSYYGEHPIVKTFKRVFKEIGEWPALEGPNWKEESFDWLNATYKLAELGYHSASLIRLDIAYLDEENRFIFELGYEGINNGELELLSEVTKKFNFAINESIAIALEEMEIPWYEATEPWALDEPLICTIKELNDRVPAINWVDFINRIAAPAVEVTENDKVRVTPAKLQKLTEVIAKTPKRNVANLMMWKSIQTIAPYLKDDSVYFTWKYGENVYQTRDEYCAEKIENEFYFNLIEMIYGRRYLSPEKKEKIKEVAEYVKNATIELIENAGWLSKDNKKKLLNKIDGIKVQIGLTDNSLDETFSYALEDSLPCSQTYHSCHKTFLDLLAIVKRNDKLFQYGFVKNAEDKSHNLFYELVVDFYKKDSTYLYIPAFMTGDVIFNEKRPNYINYELMGMIILKDIKQAFRIISSEEAEEFISKRLQDNEYELSISERKHWLLTSIAQQIAYSAYKNWVEAKGEEPKLVGVDYTQNQIFWIFNVLPSCVLSSDQMPSEAMDSKFNIFTSFSNAFIDDFKCSDKSKMYALSANVSNNLI